MMPACCHLSAVWALGRVRACLLCMHLQPPLKPRLNACGRSLRRRRRKLTWRLTARRSLRRTTWKSLRTLVRPPDDATAPSSVRMRICDSNLPEVFGPDSSILTHAATCVMNTQSHQHTSYHHYTSHLIKTRSLICTDGQKR